MLTFANVSATRVREAEWPLTPEKRNYAPRLPIAGLRLPMLLMLAALPEEPSGNGLSTGRTGGRSPAATWRRYGSCSPLRHKSGARLRPLSGWPKARAQETPERRQGAGRHHLGHQLDRRSTTRSIGRCRQSCQRQCRAMSDPPQGRSIRTLWPSTTMHRSIAEGAMSASQNGRFSFYQLIKRELV